MASKREIDRMIYLTGTRGLYGYTVITSGFDRVSNITGIESARVGHALVRTLRGLAYDRPDLFPRPLRPGR